MLILTRRVHEHLVIELPDGQILTVKSLGVKGNQTRIGIDAPAGVAVHRAEIWERIQRERARLAELTLFEIRELATDRLHYVAAKDAIDASNYMRCQLKPGTSSCVQATLWHPDYLRLDRLMPQDEAVRDLLHQAIRDGKVAPFAVTLPADLEIAA